MGLTVDIDVKLLFIKQNAMKFQFLNSRICAFILVFHIFTNKRRAKNRKFYMNQDLIFIAQQNDFLDKETVRNVSIDESVDKFWTLLAALLLYNRDFSIWTRTNWFQT